MLDTFESEHPDVVVTRLRPGLLFQADAASEVQRYFLGNSVPPQMLAPKSLPTLPLPAGIRLQALHSDDVGAAYVAAVVAKRPGAFNVCADDVLGPQELADILTDSGRYVELPSGVVRAALATAHAAGVVPADAGWLDMGMQLPMMDNARAKAELGWAPTRTAAEALTELLEGLAEGRGHDSPPLLPRNKEDKYIRGTDHNAGDGVVIKDVELPEHLNRDLFELYLSDHLTGSTGGVNRSRRMADDYIDTPVFAQLGELAEQLAAERAFLQQLIHELGFSQKPYRQAVAWAGERIGRLKGNGHVATRSPMTLLLESDLMRGAVHSKIGVWETLRDYAPDLGIESGIFEQLIHTAKHQLDLLDQVHAYARANAFDERKVDNEGTDLARQARGVRRDGPGSGTGRRHRRHHRGHLHRHLRFRPAPLRGARPLHGARRHHRPRTYGPRRRGRQGQRPERGRPHRRPLQHRLRPLLDVRSRTVLSVRDHAGPRV